jgi:hypothetical protein
MKLLFTFLILPALALAGPVLPKREGYRPTSEAALRNYAAITDRPVRIALGASMRITKDITLPANAVVEPSLYYLVSGGGKITFNAGLDHPRTPCFSGFAPGDIRGTFGGQPKFPEWWAPAVGVPLRDDGPINCAVQSTPKLTGNLGHVVSLAARRYFVSRPIDLSATYTALIGAGASKTVLETTSDFTADWLPCPEWATAPSGNHAAVVWIGSKERANASFFSAVEGMTINCFAGAAASLPARRVSGISSQCWVEECSRIHDVCITWPSGTGIGFPMHHNEIATINGLRITSFWIAGPMCRDSLPMVFAQHANNVTIDNGTIDMTLHKQVSSEYAAPGGPVYPKPAFIQDWPKVGIKAMGKLTISNVHFEGMQTAVWVAQGSGSNTIRITNIDTWCLTDAAQVWAFDGRRHSAPPSADTDQWSVGTAVLLSSTDWDRTRNFKDRVVIENVVSVGETGFLVRDRAAGVNVSTWGQGQFPNSSTGALNHYSRGDLFTPGGGTFNPAAPATDRVYFRLAR